MSIKETILPLADRYASTLFVGSEEARAALCAALDAADREIETLKYNVDTWYERFMEAAKRCHELQEENARLLAENRNHAEHTDRENAALRSALTGVMPMVEIWVDCGHDFNECVNVRNRDAARAALGEGYD
jgi:hypothetical protein